MATKKVTSTKKTAAKRRSAADMRARRESDSIGFHIANSKKASK